LSRKRNKSSSLFAGADQKEDQLSNQSKSDKDALTERFSKEALDKTADSGITKDSTERLVDPVAKVDVTLLNHPTDGKKNELSMGQEIAQGLIAGLKESGFNQQQQDSLRPIYGQLTGNVTSLRPGDTVGYFPLRGGKNRYRGGWFKVPADTKVDLNMTILAAVKSPVSYDDGQGVLYHDLKFVVATRWSDHDGAIVKCPVETAILKASTVLHIPG